MFEQGGLTGTGGSDDRERGAIRLAEEVPYGLPHTHGPVGVPGERPRQGLPPRQGLARRLVRRPRHQADVHEDLLEARGVIPARGQALEIDEAVVAQYVRAVVPLEAGEPPPQPPVHGVGDPLDPPVGDLAVHLGEESQPRQQRPVPEEEQQRDGGMRVDRRPEPRPQHRRRQQTRHHEPEPREHLRIALADRHHAPPNPRSPAPVPSLIPVRVRSAQWSLHIKRFR